MILQQCTVLIAQQYYLENFPIYYKSLQTYDGKDEKGNIPSSYNELTDYFIPYGHLKIKRGEQSEIIYDWLQTYSEGPYISNKPQNTFYYLLGYHSEHGDNYAMQICSNPLNVLSESCVNEVLLWIP